MKLLPCPVPFPKINYQESPYLSPSYGLQGGGNPPGVCPAFPVP